MGQDLPWVLVRRWEEDRVVRPGDRCLGQPGAWGEVQAGGQHHSTDILRDPGHPADHGGGPGVRTGGGDAAQWREITSLVAQMLLASLASLDIEKKVVLSRWKV